MLRPQPVFAIASATQRELHGRPGGYLTVLVLAALLAFLPQLTANSFDDTGALSVELALSTIALAASVLGGLMGLHTTAAAGILGPTPEVRAAPISVAEFLIGRLLGITAVLGTVTLVLAVAAILGSAMAGVPSPDPASIVGALAGTLAQGILFAAIGTALGSGFSIPLGTCLVIATLMASRTLIPAAHEAGDVMSMLAWALPDPARLDMSRDIAFGRPVGVAATWTGYMGACFHVAALLAISNWRLRTRYAQGSA